MFVLATASFSCFFFVLDAHYFVSLFLVASTCADICLERLVSEVIYYLLIVMLNPINSTHCINAVSQKSVPPTGGDNFVKT